MLKSLSELAAHSVLHVYMAHVGVIKALNRYTFTAFFSILTNWLISKYFVFHYIYEWLISVFLFSVVKSKLFSFCLTAVIKSSWCGHCLCEWLKFLVIFVRLHYRSLLLVCKKMNNKQNIQQYSLPDLLFCVCWISLLQILTHCNLNRSVLQLTGTGNWSEEVLKSQSFY